MDNRLKPPKNASRARHAGLVGDLGAVVFIALIAIVAAAIHAPYVLFPELGTLSHDVLRRPHGTWARAPRMLLITPFLTGAVGSLVAQWLDFGFVAVVLTTGAAIMIIYLLRSPVAPAISAGLLPLALDIRSPWYAPSLLIGLGALAAVSFAWRRFVPQPPDAGSPSDIADDIVEEAPQDYSWIPFFLFFLAAALIAVALTGWRFVLAPPLVVIAFEMFAHAHICPWADRPLLLPIACALTGAFAVGIISMFGATPAAAAASMAFGATILRAFDLHVPPALAIGLLPFVADKPGYEFPVSVGLGTILLTASFVMWRALRARTSFSNVEE